MKLNNKPAQVVFVLHFVLLLAGAVIGAILGSPNHYVLGMSLGSFLASMIPGAIGEFAMKRDPKATGNLLRLCAAVFNNRWIAGEDEREIVQEIRGQIYGPWMAIWVVAVIAGLAMQLSLGITLGAALVGAAIVWLGFRLA